MGLSVESVGKKAVDYDFHIKKRSGEDKVIAIAGNPNVGKSTLFNQMTGMRQHTGNWPGKTVASAQGWFRTARQSYVLVDIPGTYSLLAQSAEEEVARNFICFGGADAVIVVCDATCLERNLNLALQTLEITDRVILCINLMDEARKKKISINLEGLRQRLGIPVVAVTAREKAGLAELEAALDNMTEAVDDFPVQDGSPDADNSANADKNPLTPEASVHHITLCQGCPYARAACRALQEEASAVPQARREAAGEAPAGASDPLPVRYESAVEEALGPLAAVLELEWHPALSSRWLGLQLLNGDASLMGELETQLGSKRFRSPQVSAALAEARGRLEKAGITHDSLRDSIVGSLLETASAVCREAVSYGKADFREADRRADRLLTSRKTGYPVMIALLALVFWITITGANYPSQALSGLLFGLEDKLLLLFDMCHAPGWLSGMLVSGMYRVVVWVVAVMLPPMAIFFPLFTLLEDVGYLPRIAYNLDYPFKKCRACGKQALTMAMGFGCNAAGIVGCRIIDSPRERLIAMLTNSFVPCNGKFPTLIIILTMFFVGSRQGFPASPAAAFLLTLLVLLGVSMTFAVSRLLSGTLLKGEPSSFTLELPPYRRPQIGKVIVRSIFDRTVFVLGRAVCVAAPAGIAVWLLANIRPDGVSLLRHCAGFLDPLAQLMGLDGVILIAFILGLPANEIVFPIIVMAYLSQGSLTELGNTDVLHGILQANGWTWITAVSTCLFSLMHWPCSTTLLTIRKETGSVRWMLLAMAIPTLAGILLCISFTAAARFLTWIL